MSDTEHDEYVHYIQHKHKHQHDTDYPDLGPRHVINATDDHWHTHQAFLDHHNPATHTH